MKIVHVTPFYYPVIGGVENVAQMIAEYMVSKGNEVYVLTYNRLRCGGENSLPHQELINDVHVIRLKPFFSWSHGTYSLELPIVLKNLKPDVVHVHAWRHPHVFQVIKLKDDLPFKAVLHGHAPFHNKNQIGLLTWSYDNVIDGLKNTSLKKFDVIIALTTHEKNLLIRNFGVQEDKVVVIPNGISENIFRQAERFRHSCDPFTVLYLGRVSKAKNLNLLVKAIQTLNSSLNNLHLVIAGPDEGLISQISKYASSHDIVLEYMGSVTDDEKYKLYSECKVFVHPALYEPFGITLLEAQAFGKPCIITGDGGQTYVAPPGITSLYTDPNPLAMGQAISRLLNDDILYKKLSTEAKKWASRHIWSYILPKYDSIYGLL